MMVFQISEINKFLLSFEGVNMVNYEVCIFVKLSNLKAYIWKSNALNLRAYTNLNQFVSRRS